MPQPYPSSLLAPQIHNHAPALLRNFPHRHVQLVPAVAPRGTEDVPGEAFGVHAHERVVAGRRLRVVAVHERDVLDAVHFGFVRNRGEVAERSRDPGGRGALD